MPCNFSPTKTGHKFGPYSFIYFVLSFIIQMLIFDVLNFIPRPLSIISHPLNHALLNLYLFDKPYFSSTTGPQRLEFRALLCLGHYCQTTPTNPYVERDESKIKYVFTHVFRGTIPPTCPIYIYIFTALLCISPQ